MRRRKGGKEREFKEGDNDVCRLCSKGPDEDIFGKFFRDASTGFSVHQYCMFLSSGLAQKGKEDEEFDGFLIKDIKKEITRAKRLRCSFCKKLGASIGCCKGGCRETFHYKCGKENGALFQFFDTFNSFCRLHRPTQDVALQKNQTCPICRCEIGHKSKIPIAVIPLVAPCCRMTWFHNNCLQKYANSSGLYYFRCPVCNNLEEFQEEMKRMGIFIPEQDASWEKEDAFADLLFQYSRCDAKKCVCQNGREHKETSGKWRIRLCDICGQTGTHLKCQRWKKSPGEWHCDVCGDKKSQPRTRQRQIGDRSMNYLSSDDDDDDDDRESPTEDCDVNVCSVSDDEVPLAEIRNELNCRGETPLCVDNVVKRPKAVASPMRKRARVSLQRSDDEDETTELKEDHTNKPQETPECSGLHLGDIFASTSSMTTSLLLTLSGLITGTTRENIQSDFEPILNESVESDCSSEASIEFVKAVKTDEKHFNSEINVGRSAGKLQRRAGFQEVKQDLSLTTSKAVRDSVEAESCIISGKTEGRESTSVENLSVSENKDEIDEDFCCITKVVKKSCPVGNDKCGQKCDLDCCNSVARHIYQSPSPSKVSMSSCSHKDIQSKKVSGSSTYSGRSLVKEKIGKPADQNKLLNEATTEARFFSVGTNTLPFKQCVKKDSRHKLASDAASTRRKRMKLSSKKSGKRLKRFAAVQDDKVALSHKC